MPANNAVLEKNELKPWQHEQWCIPAVGAEFVAPMEDVLDLCEEEYDPRYPTVCFDEKLVAPEADVRPPEPMEPGQPERIDYEYERLGTAKLFFFVEPLVGWRHVEMTDHRTKIDYAGSVRTETTGEGSRLLVNDPKCEQLLPSNLSTCPQS